MFKLHVPGGLVVTYSTAENGDMINGLYFDFNRSREEDLRKLETSVVSANPLSTEMKLFINSRIQWMINGGCLCTSLVP